MRKPHDSRSERRARVACHCRRRSRTLPNADAGCGIHFLSRVANFTSNPLPPPLPPTTPSVITISAIECFMSFAVANGDSPASRTTTPPLRSPRGLGSCVQRKCQEICMRPAEEERGEGRIRKECESFVQHGERSQTAITIAELEACHCSHLLGAPSVLRCRTGTTGTGRLTCS